MMYTVYIYDICMCTIKKRGTKEQIYMLWFKYDFERSKDWMQQISHILEQQILIKYKYLKNKYIHVFIIIYMDPYI